MRSGPVKDDHWVTEDREVGTATDVFNRIVSLRLTGIKMGGGCRCQMSASGETHDTNPLRIDAEFVGSGANGPESPLGILNRGRVAVAFAAMTVVDNERTNTK